MTVGHGKASAVPDRFLLHAALSARAGSAADVLHRIAELNERAVAALDATDMATDQRATTSYAIQPVHDPRTGDPQGYEATMGLRLLSPTPLPSRTSPRASSIRLVMRSGCTALDGPSPIPPRFSPRPGQPRCGRRESKRKRLPTRPERGSLVSCPSLKGLQPQTPDSLPSRRLHPVRSRGRRRCIPAKPKFTS